MKELTLENVQVDCRELTEEQVKEMLSVVDDRLEPLNSSFDLDKKCVYFSFNKYCKLFGFYGFDEEQYEITYEKIMELFGKQVADVGKMVNEAKSGWYKYACDDDWFCYLDLDKNQFYGFCYKGWFNPHKIQFDTNGKHYLKATNEEVVKRLIDYANSLGFVGKMNYDCVRNELRNESDVIMKDGIWSEVSTQVSKYEVKYITEKPQHYSNGIDTFTRMEANCTKEECLAFAKGNIDKYNWRTKNQDLEDFKKIIAYANWAIKLLEK